MEQSVTIRPDRVVTDRFQIRVETFSYTALTDRLSSLYCCTDVNPLLPNGGWGLQDPRLGFYRAAWNADAV